MDSKSAQTHGFVKMSKITEEKLQILFFKLQYLLKRLEKAESV